MILISIIVFVLLIAVVLYAFSIRVSDKGKKPFEKGKPRLTSSDRILLIAPHPDDESLGCAGIIKRAQARKIPMLVVLMTSGDGYKRNAEILFKTINPTTEDLRKLGTIRHQETINAMRELGLKKKDIIFLCYPDGGTNSLFDQSWDYDQLHQGANGATNAPYPYAYQKEAPYCGENVVKNLEQIIKDFKPNMLIYPDPQDDHHDHWATSAFVEYVTSKIDYKDRQFTYLVHKGFDWPLPWLYAPNHLLLPPTQLAKLDSQWMEFYLTKDEESDKHVAVNLYKSQKEMMEPFLDAFVRKNELFATYPDVKATLVKKKPNFFTGSKLPHTILKDPENDTFINELEGLGDLVTVGFALNKDNGWLAMETRRNMAKDLVYTFHMRLFSQSGIKRVDIRVQGETASSELNAKNSIKVDAPIPVATKNNRLVIKLPADLFDKTDVFLLSADTSHNSNSKTIDRTAWRKITF